MASPQPWSPPMKPPEQLSFRGLHQQIEQAAAGFAALGVRPGEVVGLFSENSPRWLVADQGLMRLGAADAVPAAAHRWTSCATSLPTAVRWRWCWSPLSCFSACS